MSITRRGIAVLGATALSGLILPAGAAVVLFLIALAVVVTDAWQARGVPEVAVSVPPVLSRGVASTISVEVSPSRATAVKLAQSPDLRIHPNQGAGGLTATITALRRGSHAIPAVATRREGPFGLGRWYHRAGEETKVVVYPNMPAARRIATEVRLGRFGDTSRRSRGPLGLGTELESIREYLPDDDIRQVNWRATARLGTPMSNTYRVEQEREVLVLLDTGRLMMAPVGDGTERTRLDVAVDAAAAVAAVADVVGDRIGLIAFDGSIRRRMSPRRDGGDVVVTAIHDLEPNPTESDFELAFRTIAHNKRAFVLLLTDLLEETASRPLLEAIPILSRHHSFAVAGVSDPAVAAALSTPARQAADAFRTAVAVDIEKSRRSVASTLTGYGATVVDVPAEQLPRRCVSVYLRAKRRARL
ncbi:MAG TPA: DUF58 domain-containing protein [Acidimicrobiia bacterium]|nr:DUF58 domain-containing protein [Acidimicrobiia bacterium]